MTDLQAATDAALAAERAAEAGDDAELARLRDENLLLWDETADQRIVIRELQEEVDRARGDEAAEAEAARLEAERVAALPGRVQFFRDASAPFDSFTKAPTPEQQQWMRDHYHRMRVYSPYFDTRTGWYPDGIVYQDAYAIYVHTSLPVNPLVLKDTNGQPLYIPYGAKPYTQYAADITNPAFRAEWIASARQKLAKGYRGVFIDDVNYYRKIARADGTTPTSSPCYAGTLTDQLWARSMALFMWEIRQALPDVEITHNVVWSVNSTTAQVAEVAYAAADYVEVERGVNDTGIKGGTGQFGLRSLLAWVDRRHAQGVGVIFDSLATTDAEREYGLACYLLTNDGRDMLGSRQGGTPLDWWAGYDTQLGKPLGPRVVFADGVIVRPFEHGGVYVNEPGAKPATMLDGRVLGPASGAVILNPAMEQAA